MGSAIVRRALRGGVIAATLVALAATAGVAQPPAQQPASPPGDEDRVVITGMVPVPDVGEGAPYYAIDDFAVMQLDARKSAGEAELEAGKCDAPGRNTEVNMQVMLLKEAETARDAMSASNLARNATIAAEDARAKAMKGEVSMKVVEDTELARQEAVQAFEKARTDFAEAKAATGDYMWILTYDPPEKKDPRRRQNPANEHLRFELGRLEMERRKSGFPKSITSDPKFADLKFGNLDAAPGRDAEGAFIQVSGFIVNPRKTAVEMPPVTFTAIDAAGWPLELKVAERKFAPQIPPGGAAGFNYLFRPAPLSAETVTVTFAASGSRDTRLPIRMFDECSAADEGGPD